MILVDSNTWVYYFDEGLPEHAKVAPRLEALLETEDLLMPTLVQIEVAHYVVRRLGAQAGPTLDAFFALPASVHAFAGEDAKAAVRILQESSREGIGGRDAALLQAALANGVSLLVTGDAALAKAARKRDVPTRNLAR